MPPVSLYLMALLAPPDPTDPAPAPTTTAPGGGGGTGGSSNTAVQTWLTDNIIPVVLICIAILLFLIARKRRFKDAMQVIAGVLAGLAVLGIAITEGYPGKVGKAMADALISLLPFQ